MDVTRSATSVTAVVVAAVAFLAAGCGSSDSPQKAPNPKPLSKGDQARLPQATTYGTVNGAPADPAPNAAQDGTVLHVTKDVVVYDKPGGKAIAMLPAQQLNGPTWVPVIAKQAGWRQVLLPSRPNHTSGWLAGGGGFKEATSSYRVAVDLAKHKVTVTNGGKTAGTWTVAVGSKKDPTPTGRTFVLAALAPTHPTYSKLIFPLGTHSNSLDKFGGGPGTVALHGWPDSSIFGHNVSHGCVRFPENALTTLARIPLGSPVTIT